MEITVFAGISGIEKKQFINLIIKRSGLQDNIQYINFAEELVNESRSSGSEVACLIPKELRNRW